MQQRELNAAQALYKRWFRDNPDQPNPTDLSTPEKFAFAEEIGFESFALMQQARKEGLSFSKAEFFVEAPVLLTEVEKDAITQALSFYGQRLRGQLPEGMSIESADTRLSIHSGIVKKLRRAQ